MFQILNQYVNPIGLERIAWKFYFVYIVILVVECLCIYFIFVETKGMTLEEVGRLLDGPENQSASARDQIDSKSLDDKVVEERIEIAKT